MTVLKSLSSIRDNNQAKTQMVNSDIFFLNKISLFFLKLQVLVVTTRSSGTQWDGVLRCIGRRRGCNRGRWPSVCNIPPVYQGLWIIYANHCRGLHCAQLYRFIGFYGLVENLILENSYCKWINRFRGYNFLKWFVKIFSAYDFLCAD